MQLRVRVREPTPQVLEQLLQDNHGVQPPSTVTQVEQKLSQDYILASPGHVIVLHFSVLLLIPTQSAPPPCGVGFVQARVLIREPTPQLLEQLLQDDH